MSITPFFLRSSNGAGAIYLSVSENQVSEICLFQDRATYEMYPLKVQSLVSKATVLLLSEVSEQVFEEAKSMFFERTGLNSAKVLPLPTHQHMQEASIVAGALNDGLSF
jgi:hypothetical protein